MTLEEKLEFVDVDKNAALGIDVSALTVGTHRQVWLSCPVGHSWEGEFKGVRGCPFCSGARVLFGYNDMATLHPGVAAEWHPTKNGALTPCEVSPGSKKLVFWLCPRCGYEYQAYIFNKTRRGDGCPACSSKRLVVGLNDFATVHPELLQEWSPENELLPDALRCTDVSTFIYWDCECGRKYHEPISRHLERHRKLLNGERGANQRRLDAFIEENRAFLTERWQSRLNGGLAFADLPFIGGRYRWSCERCGKTMEATVAQARARKLICDLCTADERERRIARKEEILEINRSKGRSFGQTAIAFYFSCLDGVGVEQEVVVESGRRYRADIVVTTPAGARYVIEHDGERYHSGEDKRRADREKDGLMRARFDGVIHVAETKCAAATAADYSYREGHISALGDVITALIKDILNVRADVNVKRDTMKILRMKDYRYCGKGRWEPHMLERLNEEFFPEDNAGFRITDFAPSVYYNAAWRCRECGFLFIAAICNRARGDRCPRCLARRNKK